MNLALWAPLLFQLLPSSPSLALWSDGKAELAGYQLTQPRYGQLRKGHAALIYVKEPFLERERVKADPGHPPGEVFEVIKLNAVKHFQTGIYDYNLMTSVFAALEARGGQRAGAMAKLAFSSQEWCGVMFDQLLFDRGQIRQSRHSYFDGEADQERKRSVPEDLLTVDELWILVRSLPQPYLAPGEEKTVQFLPSVERSRLLHRPLTVTPGVLSRSKEARPREVPAGSFSVETWTAQVGADRYQFEVARDAPHYLVRWTGPDGELAELKGAERLPYWELNREGDESNLKKLGLAP